MTPHRHYPVEAIRIEDARCVRCGRPLRYVAPTANRRGYWRTI